jgi:hypothetical protein
LASEERDADRRRPQRELVFAARPKKGSGDLGDDARATNCSITECSRLKCALGVAGVRASMVKMDLSEGSLSLLNINSGLVIERVREDGSKMDSNNSSGDKSRPQGLCMVLEVCVVCGDRASGLFILNF